MNNDADNPDDDLAFFQQAMADVKSHKDERIEPFRQKHRPQPIDHADNEKEGDELADLAIETPHFLEFRRPGIQHRVYQDLQRGVIEPEDSLDLHGLRVVDARPAFSKFMSRSLNRGMRCVRIIHGKGLGSEGKQPVLKQKTNQWLQQTDAVLAFVSAPRWDGGTGAAYVLLSRKYQREE